MLRDIIEILHGIAVKVSRDFDFAVLMEDPFASEDPSQLEHWSQSSGNTSMHSYLNDCRKLVCIIYSKLTFLSITQHTKATHVTPWLIYYSNFKVKRVKTICFRRQRGQTSDNISMHTQRDWWTLHLLSAQLIISSNFHVQSSSRYVVVDLSLVQLTGFRRRYERQRIATEGLA